VLYESWTSRGDDGFTLLDIGVDAEFVCVKGCPTKIGVKMEGLVLPGFIVTTSERKKMPHVRAKVWRVSKK